MITDFDCKFSKESVLEACSHVEEKKYSSDFNLNERIIQLVVIKDMKRIRLLIPFLIFGELLFAQQKADSCTISAPTKLEKERGGDQQIHLVFESSCPVHDLEITIYNRWGNTVSISNQLDYLWQEKEKNPGTYYFQIIGTYENGTKIHQNGFFNLL
jgi:hypothetical protein